MAHHDRPPRPRRERSTRGPSTAAILLTAASVVLLTITVATVAWAWAGRPVEEFPAWIEAGATLAAVGAAIVAGFYAARAFQLESQREHRWEEDRRADQASQVAAWPVAVSRRRGPFNSDTGQYPSLEVTGMTVRVRNSSDLPITRARLVTSVEVVTSDGFTQELDLGSVDWFDMEPATTRDVPVPAVNETAVELLDRARGGDEYEMRVFMQFTDAAGRSWHRRSNEGHLVDGGTRRERTVAVPSDRR